MVYPYPKLFRVWVTRVEPINLSWALAVVLYKYEFYYLFQLIFLNLANSTPKCTSRLNEPGISSPTYYGFFLGSFRELRFELGSFCRFDVSRETGCSVMLLHKLDNIGGLRSNCFARCKGLILSVTFFS